MYAPTPARATALLVLAAVLAVLAACGKGDKPAAAPPGPKPISIKTAQAQERKDLQQVVPVVGTLAAFERTTISNRVVGTVQKVFVDLGARVAPGAKLAEIETDRIALQIKQAEQSLQENLARLGLTDIPDEQFDLELTSPVKKALSELAAAKVKFDRADSLYKQNLIKDFEFLDIKAVYEVAQSNLQSARDETRSRLAAARAARTLIDLRRKDLTDATILAPDGKTPIGQVDSYVVAQRHISPGEYLREGTAMFTLVADRTLKLQARVPERYLADLQNGQTVTFAVDAYRGTAFTGKVTTIDPTVDPANRTFLVEALVDNKEGKLRPGSFVQARVLTGTRVATMVPVEAVTSFAGVNKVFVLQPGSPLNVRQVQVTMGQQDGGLVEIPEGIKPGDQIVVEGQSKLIDGSVVELRAPAPAATRTAAR